MEKAGDIFRALLDRRLLARGEQYAAFFGSWTQVAGDQISAHSEIKDIRHGVVVIEVDHPGWIQLIQLRQHSLLEALRRRFPDLGIRVLRLQLPRAGERQEAPPVPPAAPPRAEATAELPAEDRPGEPTPSAQETLEQLPHNELRAVLQRLADGISKRASGKS